MPLSTPLLGASGFLLFALGLACIGLTGHVEDMSSAFRNKGTSDLHGSSGGLHDINLLPENYENGPTWIILAAGVIATVTGLVGLVDMSMKSVTSSAYYTSLTSLLAGVLSVIISLAALIYSMVAQAKSDEYQYAGPSTMRLHFTVEGWACQMKDIMIGEGPKMSKVCGEMKAARYLTIPLLILSVLFAGVAAMNARSRRSRMLEHRNRNVGVKNMSVSS